MQARVGAAGEEAAGVMVVAGDAFIRDVRGIRVAVVRDAAHRQAAVVEDRDRRGVAER